MDIIQKHAEGIICIVPQHNSIITSLFEIGQIRKAEDATKQLKDIFGNNLYLELQNHGYKSEHSLNNKIDMLGRKFNIPRVAGNDCFYVRKEDALAHSIFIKNEQIQERDFTNQEFYIKTRNEMEIFFKDYPDSLDETIKIMDRCTFTMDFIGAQLPNFPIPDGFENDATYLKHLVYEGLKKRYSSITNRIKDRTEYELKLMTEQGFSGYLLIVWDIIHFAQRSHIPVGPGRGSVAGSIVAYALGITGIDPLRYGLLFERFLNPERISMPDIDTDFCVDKRKNIITYIKQRYGEDHVGQIITFSSLKPRGAIRDVARALEIPLEDANTIAKLIPFHSKNLEEAFSLEPKLTQFDNKMYQELFSITEKILGVHRNSGIHAAGVVIGKKPLLEYVPLFKDSKSNAIATQYAMDYLEECGLVKMDILGLRTVTILADAEKMIQQDDPTFSIEKIPENDVATFKMLSIGKSEAIFQFESLGMQRVLRKVKPSRIEDLIALNALYRPGPMQHIDEYADVKNKRKSPNYHFPQLQSVLEETYGVIVYQEQVMEIARIFANYTLGEADILRRAMGKKKVKEMEEQLNSFIEGAVSIGNKKESAEEIFQLLKPFAGYGFNKSHAVAYGILAYQTAYLKCHHPLIFFVSQLNAIASNQDEVTKHIQTCKSLGIKILPPDVSSSNYNFSIEGDTIRFGLNAIKTISDDIKKHIPLERKKNGPYTSIINVIERFHDYKDVSRFVSPAIAAGLFDSIDNRRALLFANSKYFIDEGTIRIKATKKNEILLFTDDSLPTKNTKELFEYPIKKEDTSVYYLEREYLGIYLTFHPLISYKDMWQSETTLNTATLSWENTRTKYYIIGYIDKITGNIRENMRIYTGTIEDFNGSIRFVYRVKSKDIQEFKSRAVYGIIGMLRFQEDEGFTFWVNKLLEPKEIRQYRINDPYSSSVIETPFFQKIRILFKHHLSHDSLKRLKDFFMENHGKTRVEICFPNKNNNPNKQTNILLPQGFTVNANNKIFIEKLQNHPAIDSIQCT